MFGQEMNGSIWALCKMNMFLHEVDAARIEWEDTIRHPQLIEGEWVATQAKMAEYLEELGFTQQKGT